MKALNARQPKPLICCSVDKFFVQPMTTVVTPPNLPSHQPTRNCASCQVVALDGRWFNPSIRTLIAVKLMDVMLCPLGSIDTRRGFLLKEGAATVVNKMPTFSPICGHCDIFAAPRSSANVRSDFDWDKKDFDWDKKLAGSSFVSGLARSLSSKRLVLALGG
jgi:hypothetical protein